MTPPPPPAYSLDADMLVGHGDFLRRMAHGLLGDEHLAEDLVQEVWVRALESPPGELRSPRGWLSTVLRNLSLSARRQRGNASERERRSARAEALPSVVDELEQSEVLRNVVDAVTGLEDPLRATLMKRYFQGLAPREIAAEEGVPLATVRSRIQRGQQKMRERLDRSYDGDRRVWARGLIVATGYGRVPIAATSSATATTATTTATGGAGPSVAIPWIAGAGLVAAGVLTVLAWPDEPQPESPHQQLTRSTHEASAELDAATAEAPVSPTAARAPAATTNSEWVVLAGRVMDQSYAPLELTGGPASAVELTLSGPGSPFEFDSSLRSDEQGNFEIRLRDPGERPLKLYLRAKEDQQYRNARLSLELAEGSSRLDDLVLERYARGLLTGIVVDELGAATANVEISYASALDRDQRVTTKSDDDGRFELQGAKASDAPRVTHEHYALLDWTRPESLEEGGLTPVRLTLARTGELDVRVLDVAGEPVPEVEVRLSLDLSEHGLLEADGKGLRRTLQTDQDGRARLTSVWCRKKLKLSFAAGPGGAKFHLQRDGLLTSDITAPGVRALVVPENGRLSLELRGLARRDLEWRGRASGWNACGGGRSQSVRAPAGAGRRARMAVARTSEERCSRTVRAAPIRRVLVRV